MPIYTIELDGKQYDLDGDHPPTEAEARAAIGGGAPQAKPAKAPGVMAGFLEKPIVQRFLHGDKELTNSAGEKVPINAPGLGLAAAATPNGMSLAAGAAKVPGIMARGLGISKARAGANIEGAITAAKDAPVMTDAVRAIGEGATALRDAGARLPRVITMFMKRTAEGPLMPEEAQRFMSNLSRMSVNEFNALSPQMQRQASMMAGELRKAITGAAETVGKGEQYLGGVKEYARAGKAAKVGEHVGTVAKGAAKTAAYGAGLGGVYKLLFGE